MRYVLTAGWDDGVADLTERLVRELAGGRRVLWLVSGGSNIPVSVQIMDNITRQSQARLSVMLADERYGEVGHDQSNWTQLIRAGFQGGDAKLIPVLEAGLDFQQTIARYNQLVGQAFEEHDLIIAQLGIGADGHIAGILPGSPAAAETKALVAGYRSAPFLRITLTFPALRKITAAYAFAFGNTKRQALSDLRKRTLTPVRQPAQILKRLGEAYLYSDQLEDSAV